MCLAVSIRITERGAVVAEYAAPVGSSPRPKMFLRVDSAGSHTTVTKIPMAKAE